MINVGSELKRYLNWFFINAKPECKCHPRANLMDLLGPRWIRENIDTVVDWLIEEAEERGLSSIAEQPRGRWFVRMAAAGIKDGQRALCRQMILLACKSAEKKHRALCLSRR